MIKNYVAIKDGKVIANEGGTNLTAESMQKKYPQAEIKAVESTRGVPIGFPVAVYKEDFIPKTPQELEAEGLDPEGNPLPTAAELEAEAKAKADAEQAEADAAKKEALRPENLLASIAQWADSRHDAAKKEVWGVNFSLEQQERYDSNYSRAKAGAFKEKENAEIIKKYEAEKGKFDTHIDLIERARIYMLNLVESKEYEQAYKCLEASKIFDMSITEQDVVKIYIELTRK